MMMLIPATVGLIIGFILGSLEKAVHLEEVEDEIENSKSLKELHEKY